jgi:hypothetical protein
VQQEQIYAAMVELVLYVAVLPLVLVLDLPVLYY